MAPALVCILSVQTLSARFDTAQQIGSMMNGFWTGILRDALSLTDRWEQRAICDTGQWVSYP